LEESQRELLTEETNEKPEEQAAPEVFNRDNLLGVAFPGETHD
jgi:hypothetical protein